MADGIAETFEAAKKETWILTQSNAYQLRDWLRLLPFATPVSELPAIVRDMPEAQRNPHLLKEMVGSLENSPSKGAEEVLFDLAKDDPRYYLNHQWRSTILRLGTVSSALRLVDLMVSGSFSGKSLDGWHWRHELGRLISDFPDVRARVLEQLKDGPSSEHLVSLAHTIAEDPGSDGLIMLIDFETMSGRSFVTQQSIESTVTKHVPAENWKDAYNIAPVPAVELRQMLLKMATNGDNSVSAAHWLSFIDELRDEYGAPMIEPRHPDLKSGRSWPMILPDPEIKIH